jgi:HEAT repeat protein
MGQSNRTGVEIALSELFEAEQKARALAEEIAAGPSEIVLAVLADAIERARKVPDERERIARLDSIAKILGQIAGPKSVDALIDILGSEEHEARHAAGVVLEDMAFERFKEVALGVERALAQLPPDHLALSELPYILIEIPEPGVAKLVHRFLEHPNEEVAAAAIEACVELGDPSSIAKLAKLERDTRLVELDDEGAETDRASDASVTIGELAKEARLLLQSLEPEDRA